MPARVVRVSMGVTSKHLYERQRWSRYRSRSRMGLIGRPAGLPSQQPAEYRNRAIEQRRYAVSRRDPRRSADAQREGTRQRLI